MLRISFNGSDKQVAESIRAKGPQIIQAVLRKMNVLMLELQAKIVGEKLQGQVLKHRTGKLAGSIRVVPAVVQGSSVIGEVQGGGGPAFYGRVHEYGGTFNIPAHERKLGAVRGKMKARLAGGMVRSHTAVFPERSFMRTSLEEMRQQIFDGLTTAVSEELQK